MSEEAFRLKVILENVKCNRAGLRDLANVCAALSSLSHEDAKTAANHVIYAHYMNSTDERSIPMMVCLILGASKGAGARTPVPARRHPHTLPA